MAAEGVELATAYVSLTVSLRDAQRTIERELADPLAQSMATASAKSRAVLDKELGKVTPDLDRKLVAQAAGGSAQARKLIEQRFAGIKVPQLGAFDSLSAPDVKGAQSAIERELAAHPVSPAVTLDTTKVVRSAAEARAAIEAQLAATNPQVGARIVEDVGGGAERATQRLRASGLAQAASQIVGTVGGEFGMLGGQIGTVATESSSLASGFGLLGGSFGPQAAVVIGMAALGGVVAYVSSQEEELRKRHISAAEAAGNLAAATGLVRRELDKMGESQSGAAVSEDAFRRANAAAIATLRAAKSPQVQQAILVQIGYDLVQAGNSTKDALTAVQRLATAAGVTVPVKLTVTDIDAFQGQVDAAAAEAKAIADRLHAQRPTQFGVSLTADDRADLDNIAQRAKEAFKTDDVAAYARILGTANKALGDNAGAKDYLAKKSLDLLKIDHLSLSSTHDTADALRQLASSTSSATTPQKDLATSILDAASKMKGGATDANIMAAASTRGGQAASTLSKETRKAATEQQKAKAATDAFTKSISHQAAELKILSLQYDAGQAAKTAFLDAGTRRTQDLAQLQDNLSVGQSLNDLRDGLLGIDSSGDKAQAKTDLVAKAMQALNDNLTRLDPRLSTVSIRLGSLGAAADGFQQSIADSTGLDDIMTSSLDVGDAFLNLRKQLRRLPADFDAARASTSRYLPEQKEALRTIAQLGSSTTDYLATLLRTGRSTDDVRSEAARLRGEYEAQFRAVGLTEGQVQQYIRTLGLTPDQVNTAIKVSGVEAAKFKIQSYLSLLEGKIPENVASNVTALISKGDLDGAARQLEQFAKTNPVRIDVQPKVDENKKISFPKTLDLGAALLGKVTPEQQRGIDQLIKFQQLARDVIGQDLGRGDLQQATADAQTLADELTNVLKQAGLTDDQAKAYVDQLGLAPKDVHTDITLAGDAEAITRLQLLRDFLTDANGDGIPPEVSTEVSAAIAAGDYKKADDMLSQLARDREVTLRANLLLPPGVTTTNGMVILGGSAPDGSSPRGRAAGGHQSAHEPGWVGEKGPELWWPDAAGTVIPSDISQKVAMGGGGRSLSAVVNQYGVEGERSADEFVTGLRRLERKVSR